MKHKYKKPFHLIIEGADKSGKSTVCALLSKKLRVPIIRMVDAPKFFKKRNIEEASEIFNKTIAQFKDFSWLVDRGYPSSLVYSKHFKRRYDFGYIEEIKKALKPVIVILDSPPHSVDDTIKLKDRNIIRDLYYDLAIDNGWEIIHCGDLTPKQICKQITDILS